MIAMKPNGTWEEPKTWISFNDNGRSVFLIIWNDNTEITETFEPDELPF